MPIRRNNAVDPSFANTSNCLSNIKNEDFAAALTDYKTLEKLAEINTIKQVIIRFYKFNKTYNSQIFEFLEKLPTIEETTAGYKLLFMEMLRNKEIFTHCGMTLAYRTYKGLNSDTTTELSRDNFNCIWHTIPKVYKNFPWEKPFRLYNMGLKKYLIASDVDYDTERQLTFIWTSGNENLNGNDLWKIEPIEDGIYFKIVSAKYNLPLYADTNEYSHTENWRRIFLWKGNRQIKYFEWILEPSFEDGFNIRNFRWSEYLGITNSDYDNDRRETCTSKVSPRDNNQNYQWKIVDIPLEK